MARRIRTRDVVNNRPGVDAVPVVKAAFYLGSLQGQSIGVRYQNNFERIQLLSQGLPAGAIEAFGKSTGLSVNRINDAARISAGTYTRRKKQGRLSSEESERLLRLSRVFELTLDLFHGESASAQQWLETPIPALGNRRPLDLAGTEPGGREVEDLIGRIRHGIVS